MNLPVERLLPYDEHFHPTVVKAAKLGKSKSAKPDVRKLGHPLVAVNALPHEQQVIGDAMLEKWDYCLRRLFVLKGQSLKTAIGYASRFCFLTVCKVCNVDFLHFLRIGRWHLGLRRSSSSSQTQTFHLKNGSTSKSKSGNWISKTGL